MYARVRCVHSLLLGGCKSRTHACVVTMTCTAHSYQEAECKAYEAKIASYGGIHLFLAGIGTDGTTHLTRSLSSSSPCMRSHRSLMSDCRECALTSSCCVCALT
jgi:6-phosphogluconolactonase/glucosamine-6-phosphate isomerase/deaminase